MDSSLDAENLRPPTEADASTSKCSPGSSRASSTTVRVTPAVIPSRPPAGILTVQGGAGENVMSAAVAVPSFTANVTSTAFSKTLCPSTVIRQLYGAGPGSTSLAGR